jgi:DNA excision repair protein ERCC-2
MTDALPAHHEFHTTVRELVEFVHRSGDLAGESAFRSSNRAVEGTRGHRRIQEARGEDYQAEVPVERIYERPGLRLILSGRVDGIFENASPPIVEEIKTVTGSWSGHPDAVHIAQLRAYAALLAEARGWDQVDHRLIYLHLETDEQTVIQNLETRDSLSGFLDETLHEWFSWLTPRVEWLNLRDASLEALPFPFTSFRAGQRALARHVYRSVRDGRHLFVEAPTGLGKTMATLFPAIRALPRMADGQVFYVTAKTPGRLSAAHALTNLRASGARLRSLMLTAKRKICFSETPAGCDERTCPFAVGYYDRIKPAVRELLQKEDLTREAVEETARRHQVCPFELSLDASVWTDVIVGDFNHVFDPSARLQRHFAEGPARHAVLVDEAHNLVDRSREMYSARLTIADLTVTAAGRAKGAARAKRALAAAAVALEKALQNLPADNALLESKSYHDGAMAFEKPPRELLAAIRQASRGLEEFLAAQPPGKDVSGWMEAWFALSAFLRAEDGFDENCRFILSPAEGSAKIFCADPSSRLRESLKGLRAAIFFSATLSPLSYFRDLLGGSPDTAEVSFDSPFHPSQMKLTVLGHDVSYKGRSASLECVADDLARHVRDNAGNHLIFCPSLQYLSEIEPLLAERLHGFEFFAQTSLMDESERIVFLDRFAAGSQVVGLAVLGGIFSEGVDLPGDRLIGVAVVGVGLPRLSLERDILLALFETTRGQGFDYAYRFPGMQRVLQAVGRLIRSEQDRGTALLIDRRFREARYRSLFPSWWNPAPQ